MAADWPMLSLREANVTLIDCDHRTPAASDIGYPYVAIPQLRNGRIDLSDVRRITREQFVEWTRKAKPLPNDVVLSRRCNPGETAFVPPDLEFALGQNLVLLRADGTKVYPPFLRWLVRGPEWWEQIGKFLNVGAVFDSLKCADVPNFQLHIPPLAEQRAIAHILGTLDDKIDLSRRMNETLEAIARALFKSWFVDFDPVRAKAEGHDPGLPKALADLFPDSLAESGLGDMPEGWRLGVLGDVAEINAKTLSRADTLEAIDYIEISEVMRGEIGTIVRYDRGAEPSRARRQLRHGDSVLSTVRPDRGAHFLCLHPPTTLIASTGFAVLSPRDGNWAFLYSAVSRRELGEELGRLADGGAYPAVRPEAISAVPVVIPKNSQVVTAFERLTAPLFERADRNRAKSRTFASLRDALLPKLISGELRVREVDRVVSRATA
jgi:type I restriction enzyme S subunit